MLGEADLKDVFCRTYKNPIPTEYCQMQYTFCGLGFPPTVVWYYSNTVINAIRPY